MNEYKSKHIGERSLWAESHPGMVVTALVDNLGKVSIKFGNSMTLRVTCSDARKINCLIEECIQSLELDGLGDKDDYPACETAKEQRENAHRARRSAMEVPSMGLPGETNKAFSENQRVNPFDGVKEIGNDPVEW
jgi:hypothetical protein